MPKLTPTDVATLVEEIKCQESCDDLWCELLYGMLNRAYPSEVTQNN